MVVLILFILIGFAVLIAGADFLVKGSSSLARRYRISELVIGLTIVAFGTSAPELVVNLVAAIEKHPDMVLGNIIGSNNFNAFVILGIAAIIYPLSIQRSTVFKEIPYSLIAALILLLLANDVLLFDQARDRLGRLDGMILLVFFALFIFYAVKNNEPQHDVDRSHEKARSMALSLVMITGGLAGLILGGKLVVDHAVKLAQLAGISERIIGLTIVAAGTSLPELATSAVAAYRKNTDIAVGNVIGSSIFNIFFILGLSVLITPVDYKISFNADLTFFIAGSMLLIFFTYIGKKAIIDRWEGVLLVVLYLVYLLVFLI